MKEIFLFFFTIFAVLSANSQINIGIGSSIDFSAREISIGNKSVAVYNNTYGDQVLTSHFLPGTSINLNLGYHLNKHIGVDLKIAYSKSGNAIFDVISSSNSRHIQESAKGLLLVPSFLYSINPPTSTFRPYGKIGLSFLPAAKVIRSNLWEYNAGTIQTFEYEMEFKTNLGVGFSFSAGTSIRLSHKLNFQADLTNQMISEKILRRMIREGSTTSYKINGKEVPTNYIKCVDCDYRARLIEDEVDAKMIKYSPFTSIGLTIGFSYLL